MSKPLKLLLIILCSTWSFAEARILPGMTSFEKELSFRDKQIILAQPFITENESFVYAICAPLLKTFDEKHCNVSIETPAFVNATYKDTCTVNFKPDNPNLETLSKLELYAYGDDKVVFSWSVRDRDYHPKESRVRIVDMSSCKSVDLQVPGEEVMYVATYQNNLDVLLVNKTFCGGKSCRQTYNAEGKKIVDAKPLLQNYKYKRIEPIKSRSFDKSIVALVSLEEDKDRLERVFKIAADGKGTELSSYDPRSVARVSFSDGYDLFGFCTVSANTRVNCRQYDAKVNIKMNVNVDFKDQASFGLGYVRWIQVHNLPGGGILLLTGSSSGPDGTHFQEFSLMKIHQDGKKDRPLAIDGLNLQCTRIQSLRVAVTENNVDEYCFHFACKRHLFAEDLVSNDLQLVTKCMPRVYLTMAKRRASVMSY